MTPEVVKTEKRYPGDRSVRSGPPWVSDPVFWQRVGLASFLIGIMTVIAVSPAAEEPKPAANRQDVHLREPALRESSGLGVSRRETGRYWSHNDSGGEPRLFAFDSAGTPTGRCRLSGAKAIDWEDMACFRDGAKPRILVADCGDNLRTREEITLYLFDEPDPNRVTDVNDYHTIRVTYSDGPQDCEAVAVDVARRKIILVAKTPLPFAGVYLVDLPTMSESNSSEQASKRMIASRVGTLNVPMVSAMDIDPTSGHIWIVNYFQCFRFPLAQRQAPIAKQLAAIPEAIDAPKWKQIEALAVDDEHRVWLTSEGSPALFGRLRSDEPRR